MPTSYHMGCQPNTVIFNFQYWRNTIIVHMKYDHIIGLSLPAPDFFITNIRGI